MLRTRVIPSLLVHKEGLVKTVKFRDPTYLGDPINTVKIFNEKEVDELLILDIDATPRQHSPNYSFIEQIAGECFMPLSYGGGITGIEEIKTILRIGVEKVVLNSVVIADPLLLKSAVDQTGSQSIVVSIDVKKSFTGKYRVYSHGGRVKTKWEPVSYAVRLQELGAGEILLNSIDRDGTMKGYDIELVSKISNAIDIPLIACGGAGNLADFSEAVYKGGASAVSAGSLFVFHGKHRAVLINFPTQEALGAKVP